MADFSLDSWAEEYELTEDTIKVIADKGFNSRRYISKLTVEIIKKECNGISVGQSLLLQEAVESLQVHVVRDEPRPPPGTEATAAATTSTEASTARSQCLQDKLDKGDSLSVTDVMAMWQKDIDKTKDNSGQGKALIFDPLLDRPLGNVTKKARDIRDYVASQVKDSDHDTTSGTIQMGSVEFAMKTNRIPLEKITIAQYMEAILRILRAMVTEDHISFEAAMSYVGYIVKIATLAQSFKWQQVLKYDQEYHKMQAELDFAWGADNTFLMQVYLKSHPQDDTAYATSRYIGHQSRGPHNIQQKYDPSSGSPICQKYNGRAGCHMVNCKFLHMLRQATQGIRA